MNRPGFSVALIVAVTASAAVVRLPRIDNRPMHCDEAVQAAKLGDLLERDYYRYDPREFHGPTLNYISRPVVRLCGAAKLADVTEAQLRLVPAIFGIALVAGVWLVRDGLGRPAAVVAALLMAVSPAMGFYSRYYIHETLLVFFTFIAMAALWRYAAGRRIAAVLVQPRPDWPRRLRQIGWLALGGVAVGLMHATKETCIIALFVMAVAAGVTTVWGAVAWRLAGRAPGRTKRNLAEILAAALVVALAAAAVSMLLFASFGANPAGVGESVGAYFHYLGRGKAQAIEAQWHVHPWHYYLRILLGSFSGGRVWTEALIVVLAVVGLAAGASGSRRLLGPADPSLVRFLAVYTVIVTAVYSAIPYKTPWCLLGPLHGMILLAGVGAVAVVRAARGRAAKAAAVALMAAATAHLAWQSRHASFVAYEHAGNPYVYAHTTSDVLKLTRFIKGVAAADPLNCGRDMQIQVFCPGHDYWPLPWYLRDFRRVGYDDEISPGASARVIITQASLEPALAAKLYEDPPPGHRNMYMIWPPEVNEYLQFRHNVPIRAYVRKDLWDALPPALTRWPPLPQQP